MRVFLAVLLFLCAGLAGARAIGVLAEQGVSVTLTDEPCVLNDRVSNLPKRAVWRESLKSFEGCYGVLAGAVVLLYFEDGAVVALPVQRFAAVTES